MNQPITLTVEQQLEAIARRCLDIPTLQTQKSDSLDFHDCAVWSIRQALVEAYQLGKSSQ